MESAKQKISEDERSKVEKFANLVQKFGFDMERRMAGDERNRGNPRSWFLFEKESAAYKYYRELVGEDTAEREESEDSKEQRPEQRKKGDSETVAAQEVSQSFPKEERSSQRTKVGSKRRRFFEDAPPSDQRHGKSISEAVPLAPAEEEVDDYEHEASSQHVAQNASGVGGYGRHIPKDVLDEFMAKSRGEKAPKKKKDESLGDSNVGHKMMSKMGWKEGGGVGRDGQDSVGVIAANVKTDKAGIGASTDPTEVSPEDDMLEQYRKRMMLAYQYRPNPLNNPRRGYEGYNPAPKR
mmetsp:Transcript_7509/g.22783  ORF Transcript_7509/g.22783 Transcript_7509/m.22783 type:complete len:295 (-) Transcript_7509:697-1581(-)|eukprot:CAMPEP_0198723840 /NCGR_PEP_ID=MMETSP1475-20131203/1352_1 /TAXON_ID= ORGANISM="Unidentified sp., Strain CCMP1999" /NCGR_SAMPLE_ID=MMETSP1475 /ASSEMBLY_ACC=CAM_ASM_001111 /LENGTH=294 /DNA_ID=CAMNT_0044485135 /DNA_START=93 /DNA_END=977 /DNA_ORIENTATION=+